MNIFPNSTKTYVWYSLEMPHQDASSKYPQHVAKRNKKLITTFFLVEKKCLALRILNEEL